jgi:formate/nitrite transporter
MSTPAIPEALTPAATAEKAEAVALGKAALSTPSCFVLALLAGAFIGFGSTLFGLALGDSTLPFAVQRVLGGFCFCLGLTLVICCGAELFTGNILMIVARASRRISLKALLKNWALVWVGNLIGSLLLVACVYFSNLQGMNEGAVGEAFVSLAAGKVALAPVTLFFKAVLCNVLVCLAVWISFAGKTIVDKIVGLIFPITAFVACGFEHCVANMFFLPFGLLLNASGFGIEGALTFAGVAYNISLATLGNIVGGLLVGLAYWFIYRRPSVKS